jgi:hypothetical protein
MLTSPKVVPKTSAVLDPGGFIQPGIPMQGNHRQICQYVSRDDGQYRLISGMLHQLLASRVIDLPPDESNRGSSLLYSRNIGSGSSNLGQLKNTVSTSALVQWLMYEPITQEAAQEGTCSWIHENACFQEWCNNKNSKILWIHGAPGR